MRFNYFHVWPTSQVRPSARSGRAICSMVGSRSNAIRRLPRNISVEPFLDRIPARSLPSSRSEVLEDKSMKQEDIAFRFYFLNRTIFSGLWRAGPIGGLT